MFDHLIRSDIIKGFVAIYYANFISDVICFSNILLHSSSDNGGFYFCEEIGKFLGEEQYIQIIYRNVIS